MTPPPILRDRLPAAILAHASLTPLPPTRLLDLAQRTGRHLEFSDVHARSACRELARRGLLARHGDRRGYTYTLTRAGEDMLDFLMPTRRAA